MSGTTDFADRTEQFRPELLAHCYRMLGSVHDAEDLVQETYLRAWRAYGGFEGRSSVRAWLYQIATNTCLTALKRRTRRPLPSGLGTPGEHPEVPAVADDSGIVWLQPIPDALVTPDSQDPAAIAAARDSVRLALIASLQYLPPRQRAVLILRDVLEWSAADVAKMLDMTTVAVKSALQRARTRMEQVNAAAKVLDTPTDPEFRAQLHQYIRAFETSDAAAIEELLREDASLEMTPTRTWFAGRATCLPFIVRHALLTPGDWRMLPTSANGQPAAAVYLRDDEGVHQGYGIVLLTTTSTGIARINGFRDPDLLPLFGFPAVWPADELVLEDVRG